MSYGAFGSEIVFGDLEGTLSRRAAAAALEYRLRPDLTLQVGAGVGHGGRLVVDGVDHALGPGWVATAAASWRLLGGDGSPPFVLLTVTGGASGASTQAQGADKREGTIAIDVRAGVAVGATVLDVLSPYAAVRAFGGPIFWHFRGEDRLGTDQHHYQVGAGLAVALPRDVDVFVEGAPLGERAVTLGAGVAF